MGLFRVQLCWTAHVTTIYKATFDFWFIIYLELAFEYTWSRVEIIDSVLSSCFCELKLAGYQALTLNVFGNLEGLKNFLRVKCNAIVTQIIILAYDLTDEVAGIHVSSRVLVICELTFSQEIISSHVCEYILC